MPRWVASPHPSADSSLKRVRRRSQHVTDSTHSQRYIAYDASKVKLIRTSIRYSKKKWSDDVATRRQEQISVRETRMKRFAFLTGFLLLTTAVAFPLFFMKKGKMARPDSDENIRYDIDDYMAAEGL